MTSKKEIIFEPEFTDQIYSHWLKISIPWTENYSIKKYHYQSRNGYAGKAFESWLWNEGFKIVQKDRKRYLKFIGNEKRLSLFLLKYGVK
jgi:hypothetical protein